ncbi:MAG: aldo/keto reductase [Hyphomicrobiaceae bacterium]
MQMRRLGTLGPLVSSIGLGTRSIANLHGSSGCDDAMRLLSRAIDLGINHFDTADIYGMGMSEELIGRFLPSQRHRIVISTKAGIRFVPATGERRIDNSPAYLRSALEKSLKRLGRDHVDILYVHRREADRPIEEVIQAMAQLKREGKIGAIGLSEVSPATLRRANREYRIAAVQSEYSLWSREVEREMLATCRELGVTFVASSPLARGMLTGAHIDPVAFAKGDFRRVNPRFQEPAFSKNRSAIARYIDHANACHASPGPLALAWVLAADTHVIAIPGTCSPDHLADNASAARIYLTAAQRRDVEASLPPDFPYGDRHSDAQRVGVEPACTKSG